MNFWIRYKLRNPDTMENIFTPSGRDLDEALRRMELQLGASQWNRVDILEIREGSRTGPRIQ
jgi:hypothetical protein